ncbi:ABC transporter substrate-binding protein [Streptomyces sp. NPDC005345]|uniref:ABC transporter substrate-binding protein n=1 Tax=Streptomyces sp. NPDC005345 TaxID=3156877 RepID=UPI0033A0857A
MSPTRRLTTSAAALALLTATGCVSDGPGGPNLVIMANVTDRVAMSTVITAFRESHPNIRVKVTYADTGVLQKELPRQLKAGKGPDVFTVWPGSGNPASAETLANNNLLQDLTLHRYAWDLPEDVMSVAGSGGHIDIVPASYSAIGAIYAIGALKSIGGRPPTTFTQVLDLCDRARKHGKVLFALGNKTPWVTQLVSYSLAAGTVYATQPNFASDMALHHTSFAQSPWREALQKYLQMAELRSAAPGISLSMHALPASDDPAQTRMPAAVSAAYGLNVHPAHEKEAKAFVDFLASARGQNLYNSKGTTLPAIPDGTFKSDPAVAEVARRQKDETTVPFMDQRWPNSTVQQVHFQQIHDLFAGTTSVPSALKAMDRAFSDSTLN